MQGGVTPTNLARAYVQPGMEPSVSQAGGSSWVAGEATSRSGSGSA